MVDCVYDVDGVGLICFPQSERQAWSVTRIRMRCDGEEAILGQFSARLVVAISTPLLVVYWHQEKQHF